MLGLTDYLVLSNMIIPETLNYYALRRLCRWHTYVRCLFIVSGYVTTVSQNTLYCCWLHYYFSNLQVQQASGFTTWWYITSAYYFYNMAFQEYWSLLIQLVKFHWSKSNHLV